MFPSMNDVVEQVKTVTIFGKSSADYSGSVGANVDDKDWDGSIISSHKFTIYFWVGISIACVALCVVACSPKGGMKPAQARSTTSRSRSRSAYQSVSQSPPTLERSGSLWRKVFSKGQDESKGWPALRRFASRSKSQAGDVEMQRVQPDGSAAGNPIPAVPTLHNGARHTRRPVRSEHLRTDRSRIEGWRAETER
jgi:hypothetical protein